MISHFLLVGNQATPNFVPLVDSHIKATKAILVHTANQLDAAKALERPIQSRGIQTQRLVISDAFSLKDQALLEKAIEKETASGARVLCNVTCATKAMAIALFQAAQNTDAEAIYLTPRDQLVFLNRPNEKPLAIENHMRLEEFFHIHQYEVSFERALDLPEGLMTWLDTEVTRHKDKFLTAMIAAREYAFAYSPQNGAVKWHNKDAGIKALIEKLAEFGMLSLEANHHLRFDAHPQGANFVKGGWLEFYVFSLLESLKSSSNDLQDLALNVKTHPLNDPAGIKNEMDVCVLFNNQLHIIECKATGKLNEKGHLQRQAKPTEITAYLYKLDTLKYAFGGLITDGALINTQEVSRLPEERAEDYSIKIFDYDKLEELKRHLYNWLNQTNHGI